MITDENRQSLRAATETLRRFFGDSVAIAKAGAEERWSRIARGEEPAWLWNAVVQSSATNGGARHLDHLTFIRRQFEDVTGTDPLSWGSVIEYEEARLLEWLAIAANPHFQRWGGIKDRLRQFVDANRDKLFDVSSELLTVDRATCLAKLVEIPGVSDKYARNLMMDVGHPEFMDGSFALDSRLSGFLVAFTGAKHTFSGRSRAKWTEAELLAIAHAIGLTAWEMDRLVFGYWFNFVGPWEVPCEAPARRPAKPRLAVAT